MATIPPGTDLSKLPLAPNPNGEPPNFVNPPNLENLVIAVGLPLIVATSFILTIRIAMSLRVHKKLLIDDYFCILAFTALVPYFALAVLARTTARHIWDIPLSTITEAYVKEGFVFGLLTGPFIWASKIAMILLYLRVFGVNKPWFKWCCYVLIAIITPGYWQSTFISIAWCAPSIGKPWGFAVLTSCSRMGVEGPVQGALSLFADVVLLILPLSVIYSLQLSMKKKIGLVLVFSVGIIVIITGCISLHFRVNIYRSTDKFWNAPKIVACAITDSAVGIWVSSTPAIAAFWNIFLSKSSVISKMRSIFTRSTFSSSSASDTTRKNRQTYNPEGSSKNLVTSEYYELQGQENRKVSTFITSVPGNAALSRDESIGITKLTDIQQFSEVGKNLG